MAALGSDWEEGSGKIKGQGERSGGEAAQGFYLAWGLHGSGRSWSNEANPGSSCGVGCECLRAGTPTIAGVFFSDQSLYYITKQQPEQLNGLKPKPRILLPSFSQPQC